MCSHEQTEAMSFYDWYESKEGHAATDAEKHRRAALFVKHVVMAMYYDSTHPNVRPADRRRVYRLNLKQFNKCIANHSPLPRLPRPTAQAPTVSLDPALLESI